MKKILVVDDDAAVREMVADSLRSTYDVETAVDGTSGLEMVKKLKPDLVVLDVMMPGMHGFEVCQKIRAVEDLKSVKVLVVSSKSHQTDIRNIMTAGADSYLVKPFQISALVGKVNELIGGAPQALKLRFWGTRGSIASPGKSTQRYGGNTACTELRFGDQILIVDAGTGIRELGNQLLQEFKDRPIEAHLMIGHTHWDHIQGIPFFVPFYQPQNRFTIYGAHGATQGFADVLAGQMQPTYFPVSMRDMAARIDVAEVAGEVRVGDLKVTTHYMNHPGVTVGFRIETRDWIVSYISDHEPYAVADQGGEITDARDIEVAKFVRGSHLLICEAQYTDEEYKVKKGWGHSTFSSVLALAVKAEVKQIALFHHDPLHTDDMMDRYVAECREQIAKRSLKLACFGAQEGMTLNFVKKSG